MHLLSRGGARPVLALLALLAPGCEKAVLNAPPTATLELSASPTAIPETGGSSTVRAVVRLTGGSPVPDGVVVSFFTTLGAIDARAETVSGVASVTLRSTGTAGVATVSAVSGAAPVAQVEVTIGTPADQVLVTLSPANLPIGGGSAGVTATVRDASGIPAPGKVVTFSATAGATLESGGGSRFTDAQGQAFDRVTATATTTVTATVGSSGLRGQATLTVATSSGLQIVLRSEPPALPASGGTTSLVAFVSSAAGTPRPGLLVHFSTTAGSVTPASMVTDAAGRALATLTTTATAKVTARIGTVCPGSTPPPGSTPGEAACATVEVNVGSGPAPYRLVLSSSRLFANNTTLTLGSACSGSSPNPELPILIWADVRDLASRPVDGVSVTLEVKDDPRVATDGRGAFCDAGGSPASCCDPAQPCTPCTARTVCGTPTPPPTPTPTPTPTASPTPTPASKSCCNAGALPKRQTKVTGSGGIAGRAEFEYVLEDTDICLCVDQGQTCTSTIVATAPLATAVSSLVLTFRR